MYWDLLSNDVQNISYAERCQRKTQLRMLIQQLPFIGYQDIDKISLNTFKIGNCKSRIYIPNLKQLNTKLNLKTYNWTFQLDLYIPYYQCLILYLICSLIKYYSCKTFPFKHCGEIYYQTIALSKCHAMLAKNSPIK